MFAQKIFALVVMMVAMAAAFAPAGRMSTASKSSLSMGGYSMGINGFGRIGRLVARIMIEDANCNLKVINTGKLVERVLHA